MKNKVLFLDVDNYGEVANDGQQELNNHLVDGWLVKSTQNIYKKASGSVECSVTAKVMIVLEK